MCVVASVNLFVTISRKVFSKSEKAFHLLNMFSWKIKYRKQVGGKSSKRPCSSQVLRNSNSICSCMMVIVQFITIFLEATLIWYIKNRKVFTLTYHLHLSTSTFKKHKLVSSKPWTRIYISTMSATVNNWSDLNVHWVRRAYIK